jgi:hypothetical protein
MRSAGGVAGAAGAAGAGGPGKGGVAPTANLNGMRQSEKAKVLEKA